MPRAILQQGAWNAGELSPRLHGRSDFPKYAAGAKRLENVLLHPGGGFQKRSGTRYVAAAYTNTKKSLLLPFKFNNDDAYVLEFSAGPVGGVGVIRFFRQGGIILATSRTFTNANVNTGTEKITITGHFFATGQGPFQILDGGGGLPAGLAVLTDYWIIRNDANTIQLASSQANAIAGTAINLTTTGGAGPHTIGAGGSPLALPPAQVNHTFTDDELYEMGYAQSADVMYLVHKSHAPQDLTRTNHAEWTLSDHTFKDGPYLPIDQSGITLNFPAKGTGGTGIIASSAPLFTANDLGRMIRIQCQVTGDVWWGYCTITAVTDSTHVNFFTNRQLKTGSAAATIWQLGAFYPTNYPRSVTVIEQRLGFGGEPATPETIHLSVTNDYQTFAPNGLFIIPTSDTSASSISDREKNAANGSLNDSNAIDLSFGSNDVQAIKFMAVTKNLIVGTLGGLWPITAPNDEALTVASATTRKTSSYGSALRQPIQTDDLTIHLSRERRRLRAIGFDLNRDAYASTDLNHLADHIGQASQFQQIAYQQEPDTTIWVVREDGILAACVIHRDEDVLGWCRHWLGGQYGTGRTVVESVAVIPTAGADADQVWLSTVRTVNGATSRMIEVMDPRFESTSALEDGYFVDAGATVQGTSYALTAISIAATAVCTVGSTAGLSNGDRIRITGVSGVSTTDSYGNVTSLVNGRYFKVANVTPTTFDLHDLADVAYPTTGGSAFVSGGTAQKTITSLSGLTWLKNAAVTMNADGSVQTGTVDGSGNLTLGTPAAKVQIGLAYTSLMETLPIQVDEPDGSGQGLFNRPAAAVLRLLQTCHLKLGRSDADLEAIADLEASSDPTTTASALHGGDFRVTVPGGWERGQGLVLSHALPLPWEQVSAMLQVESGRA